MNYVEIAKSVAIGAHSGQFRKDGVTPYITHPETVAATVAHLGTEYEATAWLHDVLEDCPEAAPLVPWSVLPESVKCAVELLTKRSDQNYLEYVLACYGNPIATAVKAADIKHNLSTGAMKGSMADKWRLALFLLTAERFK